MHRPRVGITVDNDPEANPPGRYRLAVTYPRAVTAAGGVPLPLPQEPSLAATYLELCDAIILTGGRDPHTEAFGEPRHPQCRPLDPARQAFELALLEALQAHPDKPVLGICLGMQMLALHAGGRLNQHLPDTLGEEAAAVHRDYRRHTLNIQAHDSVLLEPDRAPAAADRTDTTLVSSSHHQAVGDPGVLRVVATAPDGVIEAIDRPADQHPFYLGVQWHPERGGDDPFNLRLIQRLVDAARATTSAQ